MQILPSRSLVSLSYPFSGKDDRVAAGCHAIHQVLTDVWPSLWWGTPVICKPPNERSTWAPGARRGLPAWLTFMQTGSNVLLHSRWRMTDLTHYGGVSLVIWIHLKFRLWNYLRKTFYNPRSLKSLVWQLVCLCWSCVFFSLLDPVSSHAGSYSLTECADICMSNLCPNFTPTIHTHAMEELDKIMWAPIIIGVNINCVGQNYDCVHKARQDFSEEG